MFNLKTRSITLGLGVIAGLILFGSATLAQTANISAERAIEIATTNGGEFKELELEKEDGRLVYEVVVTSANGTAQEFTIDAMNGEILETELEDDEDDEDDD